MSDYPAPQMVEVRKVPKPSKPNLATARAYPIKFGLIEQVYIPGNFKLGKDASRAAMRYEKQGDSRVYISFRKKALNRQETQMFGDNLSHLSVYTLNENDLESLGPILEHRADPSLFQIEKATAGRMVGRSEIQISGIDKKTNSRERALYAVFGNILQEVVFHAPASLYDQHKQEFGIVARTLEWQRTTKRPSAVEEHVDDLRDPF